MTEKITKEYLIEEHVNKRLPYCVIAKQIGCHSREVKAKLLEYGIYIKDIDLRKWKNILTKDFLEKEHILNLKSCPILAKEIGCDKRTIANYLKVYNLPIIYDIAREKANRILTKEYLVDNYSQKEKSIAHIALETGVHPKIIKSRLLEYRISLEKIEKSSEFFSSLLRKIRGLQKYKDWRTTILKRDSFTCVKCSYYGNYLEVDHKVSLKKLLLDFLEVSASLNLNEKNKLDLVKKWPSFWDINNGQTLCFECHNKVERDKLKDSIRRLTIPYKKLDEATKAPFRKNCGDGGYDLFASRDILLKKGIATYTFTGLALDIPDGYYAEIHGRSSLNKQSIINLVGIIDQDYHGEISSILISMEKDYQIKKGDRIGQLIFKKRIEVSFEETNENFDSDRGTGGFGSTGK